MAKKSYYHQSKNGDILPVGRFLYIQCCDCGLVHRYEHRIVDNRNGKSYVPGGKRSRYTILQQVIRANRSTAQVRRHRKPA